MELTNNLENLYQAKHKIKELATLLGKLDLKGIDSEQREVITSINREVGEVYNKLLDLGWVNVF